MLLVCIPVLVPFLRFGNYTYYLPKNNLIKGWSDELIWNLHYIKLPNYPFLYVDHG